MRKVFLGSALIFALILGGVLASYSQGQPKTHTITVKFDYDFTAIRACPAKSAARCVKQFNVYNLTDTGRRILLFSIPAPPGATAKVPGISGHSKPLIFAPGQHLIGVAAVASDGAESDPHACTTMVNIAS